MFVLSVQAVVSLHLELFAYYSPRSELILQHLFVSPSKEQLIQLHVVSDTHANKAHAVVCCWMTSVCYFVILFATTGDLTNTGQPGCFLVSWLVSAPVVQVDTAKPVDNGDTGAAGVPAHGSELGHRGINEPFSSLCTAARLPCAQESKYNVIKKINSMQIIMVCCPDVKICLHSPKPTMNWSKYELPLWMHA